MPGNPYNTANPNANFFNHFLETFQNQNENQNTSPKVIVTDTEFIIGNKTLSRTCPHNGCRLNYNQNENKFICPCHASSFNFKGDCLKGPACPKNIRKSNE